jgi:hypothetical protein
MSGNYCFYPCKTKANGQKIKLINFTNNYIYIVYSIIQGNTVPLMSETRGEWKSISKV